MHPNVISYFTFPALIAISKLARTRKVVTEIPQSYFKRRREHLAALEKAGLLVKIDEAINKDTELMPLVRWQFRAFRIGAARVSFHPRHRRQGKKVRYFPSRSVVSAASRQIYGFGLQCKPEEIVERWTKARIRADRADDR